MSVAPRPVADTWRRLNGLVCIFKPAGCSVNHCMKVLRHKLTSDLNAVDEARLVAAGAALLEERRAGVPGAEERHGGVLEPEERRTGVPGAEERRGGLLEPVERNGSFLEPEERRGGVPGPAALQPVPAGGPSWQRLVSGPAFLPPDVRVTRLASLGRHISGPLLLGVNSGTRLAAALRQAGPQLRVHQVTARLGVATDTLLADGRATERAAYGHVTRGKLEAVLGGLQSAHQRLMFEHTGLPVNSQAAYELATRGPPRPARGSPPVLYGLRCVQFAPPFFTLELHSCNESEQYLLTLVDDLGRQLRTAAVTVRARCLRHGPFTLQHALLMKHWRLEHIQRNMRECMVTTAEGLAVPVSATLQTLGGAQRREAE